MAGGPSQIAKARALIGDAKAVLLALKALVEDKSAAPGRSRVAPAILTKNLVELAELSEVVRSTEYEQQLRNQERQHRNQPKGKEAGSYDTLPNNY